MKRMKASDFHPRLLELYDGYVHGKMSKRDFLTGASRYVAAGGDGHGGAGKPATQLCARQSGA